MTSSITVPSTHGLRCVARSQWAEYARPGSTRPVTIGSVRVGAGQTVMIAGPCTVESREQTLEIAGAVQQAGAAILRGGAYKPRTSPYAFQGLGEAALEILAEARRATGLPFVTEVMDPRLVETVGRVADALQIGSRSMQNFPLLREVGRLGKPVLLKRGFGNTVHEWLHAAEYIAAEGNLDIVLCERGIRTFADGPYARSTLDLAAIRAVREQTFLPVIVDPSHAAGRAELVPALAAAALAAGAQGLLVEVVAHAADRETARCDGPQGVLPADLAQMVRTARALR